MSPEESIRNARYEDLDAMVGLLRELFSLESDFRVDERRQRRGLALMLDGCGKHRCLQVAEIDGQVVGMCSAQILISTAEGGQVAWVEDLVVTRHHRGRRIGRRLLRAIESWGHKHGLTRLQLLADRTNSAALNFYDRQGWRPTRLVCLRRTWPPMEE